MNINPVLSLDLKAPVKFVLTVLTFRAFDDDLEAHLTNEKLVQQTGLSKRTVQNAVKELEELGLILVRRTWGRGNYNIFKINYEKVQEMHQKANDQAAPSQKNLFEHKGAENPEKGAENALKGAENALKGAGGAPTKTINNKNKTRAREARTKNAAPVHRSAYSRSGREVSKDNRHWSRKKDLVAWEGLASCSDSVSVEAWAQCLQEEDVAFGLPESAILSNIEQGRAKIQGLTKFQREQFENSGKKQLLELELTKRIGHSVTIEAVGA